MAQSSVQGGATAVDEGPLSFALCGHEPGGQIGAESFTRVRGGGGHTKAAGPGNITCSWLGPREPAGAVASLPGHLKVWGV